MKIAIIISAAAVIIAFTACNSSSTKTDSAKVESSSQIFNLDTTKLKSGESFYQCEMDPEVLSDKPGNCPKCGMALIERTKQ